MQATVSELVRFHIFEKDLAKPVIKDMMFPLTQPDLWKCMGKAIVPLRKQGLWPDDKTLFEEVSYMCACLLLLMSLS